MNALLLALFMIAAAVIAYFTYGRFLGRRIFKLDPATVVPSKALQDNVDYVPTDKHVLFGHHFTTIAGLGPIVGPAIAIIWGWVPAILWVLIGSIFIGAVHDFGALVVSMRNKGWSIGELSRKLINARVRILFLLISFFLLLIVIAVFALIIAILFQRYPAAVIPVWVEVPIAIALGWLVYKRSMNHRWLAILAIVLMYAFVVLGAFLPVNLETLVGTGNGIITWMLILFAYAYIASTLPVQTLLQPRDYLNSHQLIIAMGLLFLGVIWAAPRMVAPEYNPVPEGAPPIWPFLFVVIACGAVSGFHCLASSGTTSKQCASEPDARFVGYGGMLTEGVLATLVIVAVGAGLGLMLVVPAGTAMDMETGTYAADFAPYADKAVYQPANDDEGLVEGYQLTGADAFNYHYRSWGAANGLGAKLDAFVFGSANMVSTLADHIPGVSTRDLHVIVLAVMAVFLVSFAATTLDSATRIQRYVLQELWQAWKDWRFPETAALAAPIEGDVTDLTVETATQDAPQVGALPAADAVKPVRSPWAKHIATFIAVVTAMGLAFYKSDGRGALTLWPLFGAVNQLMAGLALLVLTIYLARRQVRTLYASIPMVFMVFMTGWALIVNLGDYLESENWLLLVLGSIILLLEIWMIAESARVLWGLFTGRATGEPRT